jgi:hypothetical protein
MPLYQYTDLVDELVDIRLVTLLPGRQGDQISITISHAALVSKTVRSLQRLSLEKLRETIPHGWTVHETAEGRYLFERKEDDHSTWLHSVAGFDTSVYELPREESLSSFEPHKKK